MLIDILLPHLVKFGVREVFVTSGVYMGITREGQHISIMDSSEQVQLVDTDHKILVTMALANRKVWAGGTTTTVPSSSREIVKASFERAAFATLSVKRWLDLASSDLYCRGQLRMVKSVGVWSNTAAKQKKPSKKKPEREPSQGSLF